MTKIKTMLATAAAAAMLTTTTAVAAAPAGNPAASLSVTRAASPSAKHSNLGADVSTGTLISIGILAALVVIVLVATKDSNNGSSPASR